ncbi:FAD-binding oxidoreductase [Phytoactinopolyspora halotolerans]|uniref:FAD-binding oxidoreductase n=1 Tax=Phytoactinopolyspora halotolerans TaxID=1981512 RepID=A0A6L9S2P2_9ACTN|nr:FAD-binding oxidoreductase [Phytoactinopolyspora halotolerans]NED99724.1 FAD-binding oxidoreductase [Phytoactinopolyspora halotolerans]
MTTMHSRPAGPATELLDDLRGAVGCTVLAAGDAGYDDARRVWNGVIDRRPAVIVQCDSTDDVAATVRIAGRHRPEISVRGGGHQVAGSAVCDDGLVIDLSRMDGVTVDPVTRTARVQGGARWADVDGATQRHGLVTTGGEVSRTGVAGLTLGGGMGLLHRAFGLACDNLRSIEVVTADGQVRTASTTENPDLFWAARGAGRGLGVVTAFEFGLHPFGPDAAVAQVIYPYDEAATALRRWRDATLVAPETVSPEAALWSIPPDPEIPAELHGTKVFMAAALYAGDPAESGEALTPYRRLGTPMVDQSGTVPYVAVQSALDELVPDGGRYYFKSHFMDELRDEAITTLLDCDRNRPTPETLIVIRTLGGAIDRVSRAESAYAHRGARFNLSIDCLWTEPADDDRVVGWARQTWRAMKPFASGGVYINFAGLSDEDDVSREAIQGADTSRLEGVLSTYDPTGLFASAAARL